MRYFLSLILVSCSIYSAFSQKYPLTYFLPDTRYDSAIPTPESVFGHQIGEWHLSHDKLLMYYEKLDAASERVTLHEYARSYENRPLICLVITAEKNQRNIDKIREEHVRLTDPGRSGKLNVKEMPVVIYQGFTIHGNESSGANAAVLVAYYLAAAQDETVREILDNTVILFDPCFNPDGFQRFSTWANMHRNRNMTSDNADREYHEAWPGGRTNHYWFDLNRDWLPAQQPESAGRIKHFHHWKPNVLTDHHEMGTNSTFFFMPGIQSRINPNTPQANQDLTFAIGKYHAKALDQVGSLYYSEEGYDDFYYGKGSTFPDANGCIGILFEQASSRGHLQQSDNGVLSFPFTIRNQVITALSTQEAAVDLRADLLQFQRDFFKNSLKEGKKDSRRAFIVGEPYDRSRLLKFVEMLIRQDVEVYELTEPVSILRTGYTPGHAYIIPLEQAQFKLINGMFQKLTSFSDSIFYDVSAWTLPLAFNLEYHEMGSAYADKLLGDRVTDVKLPEGNIAGQPDNYAFAFEWDEYYAPAALYYLLQQGLNIKVASKPFLGKTLDGEQEFTYGTILVHTQNQPRQGKELTATLKKAADLGHLTIYGLHSGLTREGIDLGSNSMETLRLPKILLLTGEEISSYDAGEVWHLFDTRYEVPVTKIELKELNRSVLERFNTVIMPSGAYKMLDTELMREWVREGGLLIGLENAVNWLEGRKLLKVTFKKKPDDKRFDGQGQYIQSREDQAALRLPGSIFGAKLDFTHPLAYGYRRNSLPIFRSSNQFMEPAKNIYATPLRYHPFNPLIAGYMHPLYDEVAKASAGIIVGGQGRGRVIAIQDNTNFRAFWYGTNKLLANAVFFGHTISDRAVER